MSIATEAPRGRALSRRNSAQAIRRRPAEHDRQGGIGVSLMPIHALPTREGFGSRLLKRVLTVQTGADVKIDFDPDGLRVTVALPLCVDQKAQAGAP